MIEALGAPAAQSFALAKLNEAQRRLVEMVYRLSDGRPDTPPEDVQEALGWASLGDVEAGLGELREWGLAVSVPSRWQSSEYFGIAPGAGKLVANLDRERDEVPYDVQPRNNCVEAFSGNLESARIERGTRHIPEMVLL